MEELKAILVFFSLCVPFVIGTIWAVVDVAQKDFGSPGAKAAWWGIASIPFVGFLASLFVGYRRGRKAG